MDIATLGLRIVNDLAVRAIEITSAKLDAMGAKADKAAAQVENVGTAATRTSRAVDQQSIDLDAASTAYDRLYGHLARTSKEMQKAELAAYKMNAAIDAAARNKMASLEAQAYIEDLARTAKAMEAVTTTAGTSVGGLGRLRQSFTSLAAQATGTSPVLDRIATTLGAFALGNGEIIAVVAGIAAVGAAWHAMTGGMSDDAQFAEDAIKRLTDEVKKARDAMGTLSLAAAKANLDAATLARNAAVTKAGGTVNADGTIRMPENTGTFGAMTSAADADATQRDFLAAQDVYNHAQQDAAKARADGLADLIRSNSVTADERQKALRQLANDKRELAGLLGKSDDASMDRRVALTHEISALKDALFPKTEALADARARAKDLKDLVQESLRLATEISKAPHNKVLGIWDAYDRPDPTRKDAIRAGAAKALKAQGDPLLDPLRAIVDQGAAMQARIDIMNATRAAHGQGPIDEGRGTAMDTVRKNAAEMGDTLKQKVEAANLPLETQKKLLEDIAKLLKEIGANAPRDKGAGGWQGTANDAADAARSAADVITLFGSGPRATQYGSILNTGANAVDDITNGKWAQAGIAILSLGKQVFSLGKQSHDAARQVAEASAGIKLMLQSLTDSLNHNALGSLLDQAQAAYDAQRKQINDSLSGKKKEQERNADLAHLAELYAQRRQQITEQYGKQQVLDAEALQARLLRAKGLTYQADFADLAVKQQEEYNAALLAGRDQTYLAALAQTQLAEKTALANREITQLANAPTGFYAELYAGAYASRATWSGNGYVMPGSTPAGTGSGGATVTGNTITINVPASADPAATARAVVGAIRRLGQATLGANTSVAAAMEYL